ncbi:MAG: hypothetical protein QOD53_2257 [Thermoleophilaceae bacterium]|jgi:hypothetical protein|nr:hypothetical protein [Thermoleophilaceae bacterium]
MENLSRTAIGTLAALVLGLAIGGGGGALAFGGNDGKNGAGEASLGGAKQLSPKEVPFFVVNRPGRGYDLVPKPGFKLDMTGDDSFHVINLDPPADPPPPKSEDPPPVPKVEDPPPAPKPPVDQPKLPEQPKKPKPPIQPQQASAGPLAPQHPVIPAKQAKKKAPKGCRTAKQRKSKKCKLKRRKH